MDTGARQDEGFFNSGASMNRFKNSQSTDSRLLALVARPRFLRAMPSVLLLTTAMAWGVGAQAAAPGHAGALRGSAASSASAKPDEGVRLGANDNVTAEQRAAALQVAQGVVGAGTEAGATGSATSGQSRTVGGVRGTGQAAGGTAAPMGESAVGGVRSDGMSSMGGMSKKSGKTDKGEVKADETAGLKGNVGSVPRTLDKAGSSGAAGAAGGMDTGAGVGVGAGAAGVKRDADVKAGAGIKGKSPSPY
jgi:hypothetical protein